MGVRGHGGLGAIPVRSPLTHIVYCLPFFSYLAASKSVRPGYDDKYRSGSYRFASGTNIEMVSVTLTQKMELKCEVATFKVAIYRAIRDAESQEKPTNCGTTAADVLDKSSAGKL